MPNLPKGIILEVITMWSADSNFLWSVDWDGATAVSTINFGTRVFTARTSKADILANRTSNGYWVDAPNNKLWVNVYGNDGWTYPTDPDQGLVSTWSRSPYNLKDLAGSYDQVDLTFGTNFQIRKRGLLALAIVEPITGPRPFNLEAIAQFNYRF